MASTTCALEDCTVEICTTWRHLDLQRFKSNDVFEHWLSNDILGLRTKDSLVEVRWN